MVRDGRHGCKHSVLDDRTGWTAGEGVPGRHDETARLVRASARAPSGGPSSAPDAACALPYRCSLTSGIAQGGRPVRLAVRPQIAEQVGHRRRLQQLGRAERQAADRAQLLLELAGAAGVERQVAGVVRPRRELVDQQPAVARRRRTRCRACRRSRAPPSPRGSTSHGLRARSRRGTSAGATDTSRMWCRCTLSIGPKCDKLAVHAARGDHRDLALEIDERFEHRLAAARATPRPRAGRSPASIRACPLPS